MSQDKVADNANTTSPQQFLLDLVRGMRRAQIVYMAARLKLADLVQEGPRSIDDLAAATHSHAPTLSKLLAALIGMGIFAETESGEIMQNEYSSFLCSERPDTAYNIALFTCAETEWNTWGNLAYTLQTGKPAFDHVHGKSIWQYTQENPEARELFDAAMTDFSKDVNQPVASSYDFSAFRTLVDIGGGRGSFLAAVLKTHPGVRGTLLDRPQVLEGTRQLMREEGLLDRCEFVGGSFLEVIPPGADAYTIKSVLHDWDDEHCLQILRNCRKAMSANSKLLIIEYAMLSGQETPYAKIMDLQLLLQCSGHVRTEAEFRALFAEANLTLTRIIRIPSLSWIVEGVPA